MSTNTKTLTPGTNTPGRPFFSEGGCWRRRDTYVSNFDGKEITELRFAAGKDDGSAIYKHWEPGKYASHCAHCWHGFSHTEAAHAQAVRRWLQSDQEAESQVRP